MYSSNAQFSTISSEDERTVEHVLEVKHETNENCSIESVQKVVCCFAPESPAVNLPLPINPYANELGASSDEEPQTCPIDKDCCIKTTKTAAVVTIASCSGAAAGECALKFCGIQNRGLFTTILQKPSANVTEMRTLMKEEETVVETETEEIEKKKLDAEREIEAKNKESEEFNEKIAALKKKTYTALRIVSAEAQIEADKAKLTLEAALEADIAALTEARKAKREIEKKTELAAEREFNEKIAALKKKNI